MKGLMMRKRNLLMTILLLGFLGWSLGTQAQEYPTRPITMLICHAPGAGTDVCSRMAAQGAAKILGQEIVPVNKPGGGGAVAAGILANSKGDGYTLLAHNSPALTSIPYMESVPYDPMKDIVPVIQFGVLSPAIMVLLDSPHKSFKDLIDFARKNPGKLSFGMPGIGCYVHLAMEHVMMEDKVNIAIIPYTGGVPAMTALLGGHISIGGGGTSMWAVQYKAGKLRVLATTTEKRQKLIPEAPTLSELGYSYSGFEEIYVISAPKGTPPAIVKKLEEAFRKGMETTGFITAAENFYIRVENPLSGQPLQNNIQESNAKFGEIIRKAKLGKYSK